MHVDSCQLRLADGKLHMFLAIDRVSKFTYVEFLEDVGKANGGAFLRSVIAAFPYRIHTVLTDNGMAFADLSKNRHNPSRKWLVSPLNEGSSRAHISDHQGRNDQGIDERIDQSNGLSSSKKSSMIERS